MASPTFRRFWVKVAGDKFYPQFDLEGNEHTWREPEYQVHPDRVLFLPFPEKFAELVRSKGVQVESCPLPSIEFCTAGQSVQWCRPSTLRLVPHNICGFCGAELPENVLMICPRCFATGHWYCDICDEFKQSPKVDDKNNQVLCPDCDVPRGLMRIEQIGEYWEEFHSHYNVIEIDGNRHLILDCILNR